MVSSQDFDAVTERSRQRGSSHHRRTYGDAEGDRDIINTLAEDIDIISREGLVLDAVKRSDKNTTKTVKK